MKDKTQGDSGSDVALNPEEIPMMDKTLKAMDKDEAAKCGS